MNAGRPSVCFVPTKRGVLERALQRSRRAAISSRQFGYRGAVIEQATHAHEGGLGSFSFR